MRKNLFKLTGSLSLCNGFHVFFVTVSLYIVKQILTTSHPEIITTSKLVGIFWSCQGVNWHFRGITAWKITLKRTAINRGNMHYQDLWCMFRNATIGLIGTISSFLFHIMVVLSRKFSRTLYRKAPIMKPWSYHEILQDLGQVALRQWWTSKVSLVCN